ncbi:MAG: hypothetical protein GY796_09075 [Chloroflexi bacterium]|nr:hypothetical protein [Chloroflexota bacterium]
MITVKQYKTEFVTQAEAAILPRVTMTQFMMVIACAAFFFGVLRIPLWLSPLPLVLGYASGYRHHGELSIKRLWVYVAIFLRQQLGRPRRLNLQHQWDSHEMKALRQEDR